MKRIDEERMKILRSLNRDARKAKSAYVIALKTAELAQATLEQATLQTFEELDVPLSWVIDEEQGCARARTPAEARQ